MSLGEKLLSLRKKKGLSQEEVADILHVTRQTVSKWETDQSMPDFDKVVPICNLYEISTDELFKEGEKSVAVEVEPVADCKNYSMEYAHKKLYLLRLLLCYIFCLLL